MDANKLDILWVILCAAMVLLMQGGFLCLESGISRTKNSINVALKNLVDLTVCLILFWLVGFGLMFGKSELLLFGTSDFFPDFKEKEAWFNSFFLFQAMFSATAATIVSGAISERSKFRAYLYITVMVSVLIYPIIGHWAWGGAILGNGGWLESKGFIDFAGSTVVHSTGGWVALAAIIVIGPRHNRFEVENSKPPIASYLPLAMLGIVFFMVGWIGFNAGSTLQFNNDVPFIILNTLLAGACGSCTAYFYGARILKDQHTEYLPLNGALAGLVAITANCNIVSTMDAALIGAIGAIICIYCEKLLHAYKLDDPISAIPVHLAAGIWGTLAVALFGDLGETPMLEQLWVQLQGIFATGFWAFLVSYSLLSFINSFDKLRVSLEDEKVGLNISEHGCSTILADLLFTMEKQQVSGDLSSRAPIDPFSEIGEIAQGYNAVLDTLEESQERTQAIIQDMQDGIITFDNKGYILSMNPGAAKLLSVNVDDVLNRPVDKLFTEFDVAECSDAVSKPLLKDSRLLERCELIHQSSVHHPVIYEFSASAFKLSGKELYSALIRDISDRKAAEEQLHEQKELAQTTLEALSEAVITTDDNMLINYMNPVAEQLIQNTKKHCLYNNLDEILNVMTEGNRRRISFTQHIANEKGEFEERNEALILVRKALDEISVKITTAPIISSKNGLLGSVITIQDISKSRELQKKLSYQATHDAITGLLNRREFENRLQRLIKSTQLEGNHHILCYLDLDQFKIVNDTCGHSAGDELLRQLSNQLRQLLRGSDSLARLGGDEFGIILHNCPEAKGLNIAETIREKVQSFRFNWQNQMFSVGVSIGVVIVNSDVRDIQEILSLADAACYTAKNNGRNRVHMHRQNDEAIVQHRGQMRWASRIQNAIDEDRFRLFYQSIVPVDASRQEPPHFEMFVRMLDEDMQIVSPGVFIPAAERFDLMPEIDEWILRNTLLWLEQFQHEDFICAINLSGTSMSDENFMQAAIRKFEQYAVDPKKICFEITETAAIANIDEAREFILGLKSLGCKFSLDDFGSGLSSFGYLKSLPVDYLKIDGMFVKDITNDAIDKAMVESINSVGHVLKLKTIAEFVEDEASLEELRNINVDYAQGYHINKPTPIEEMNLFGDQLNDDKVA